MVMLPHIVAFGGGEARGPEIGIHLRKFECEREVGRRDRLPEVGVEKKEKEA